MAFSKEFERELDRLFQQRTHWLRRELGSKGAGKPPVFNRHKIDNGIERLQTIASKALASKLAKVEFQEYVGDRKNYHIKGWGPVEKKRTFEAWFKRYFEGRGASCTRFGVKMEGAYM
jgi:hypothetical protein